MTGLEDLARVIDIVPAVVLDPEPNLTGLDFVSVEIGGALTRLFSFKAKTRERAEALEQAILARYEDVVGGLVTRAERENELAIARIDSSLAKAVNGAVQRIEQELKDRTARFDQQLAETDPVRKQAQIDALRAQIEADRAQFDLLTRKAAAIRDISLG